MMVDSVNNMVGRVMSSDCGEADRSALVQHLANEALSNADRNGPFIAHLRGHGEESEDVQSRLATHLRIAKRQDLDPVLKVCVTEAVAALVQERLAELEQEAEDARGIPYPFLPRPVQWLMNLGQGQG